MRENPTGWLVIVFVGVILGFLTMTQWTPYNDYVPVALSEWVLVAGSLLGGVIVVLLFEEGPNHVVGAGTLLFLAIFFPVMAAVITAYLLGTTGMMDVIVYVALQRGLGRGIQLFIFLFAGVAVGMFVRMRVRI